MQIDFHHTATYVVARLAGFAHNEASTIAYASQYVDDSTNKGTILFDNGKTYERIASAHKVFDVAIKCGFLFIFFQATTACLRMRRIPHSFINASCARQTVPYRRICGMSVERGKGIRMVSTDWELRPMCTATPFHIRCLQAFGIM